MHLTSHSLLPLFLSFSAAVVTHARGYDSLYDARDSLSSRAAGYYRQDARRFAPHQARELVDELLASRELDSYYNGLYDPRMLRVRNIPSPLLVRELEGRLGETLERRQGGKDVGNRGKFRLVSGTDKALIKCSYIYCFARFESPEEAAGCKANHEELRKAAEPCGSLSPLSPTSSVAGGAFPFPPMPGNFGDSLSTGRSPGGQTPSPGGPSSPAYYSDTPLLNASPKKHSGKK